MFKPTPAQIKTIKNLRERFDLRGKRKAIVQDGIEHFVVFADGFTVEINICPLSGTWKEID